MDFQPEPADDTVDIPDPSLFPDADNSEIPGVDVEQDTPQIFETNDLNTIVPEPPLIENDNEAQANHFPPDGGGAQTAPLVDTMPGPISHQPETEPNVRRSTRSRSQPQSYVPQMQGNKYSYAVTQLEIVVLHPDSHMFVKEDFYQRNQTSWL